VTRGLLQIATPIHGRVLVEGDPQSRTVLIGCHGYGQNAEAMLDEMRRIPNADTWRLVSVQALHRFYTRNDRAVVASWMTREDRELAIADNIEYMRRVVEAAGRPFKAGGRVVFIGFSQGASMAARAAARTAPSAAGLILLAGDIPPDVKGDPSSTLPPTLVGCGSKDTWYGARVDADVAFLESRGIPHERVRFDGGHEWTDDFRTAAGRWIMHS
jgi:predicted esterase